MKIVLGLLLSILPYAYGFIHSDVGNTLLAYEHITVLERKVIKISETIKPNAA